MKASGGWQILNSWVADRLALRISKGTAVDHLSWFFLLAIEHARRNEPFAASIKPRWTLSVSRLPSAGRAPQLAETILNLCLLFGVPHPCGFQGVGFDSSSIPTPNHPSATRCPITTYIYHLAIDRSVLQWHFVLGGGERRARFASATRPPLQPPPSS